MKISELYTPSVILDLDVLEKNISRYANAALRFGKEIWPMLKTHKSTELIKMQVKAGATGVLAGTWEEAEVACRIGLNNIMYAYPVSGNNLERAVSLAKKCDLIVRIDDPECARFLADAAEAAGVTIGYTVIIDCGLHRFGMDAESAVLFLKEISGRKNLIYKGISSHPGQVYGLSSPEGVPLVTKQEMEILENAAIRLTEAGYKPAIVSSGSTPTFFGALASSSINIYHPGNYVFNDAIQLGLGAAKEEDCALTVLATVISQPGEGRYIIDAGSKCFGLDQGAHGSSSVKGFGYVIDHPELVITGLSEEVGKLTVEGSANIRVGDQLRIIPNHACSTANLTSYYVAVRGDEIDRMISVDLRDNSTTKNVAFQEG